jgi:hypothetical protein
MRPPEKRPAPDFRQRCWAKRIAYLRDHGVIDATPVRSLDAAAEAREGRTDDKPEEE